jgi:hypothetical protein
MLGAVTRRYSVHWVGLLGVAHGHPGGFIKAQQSRQEIISETFTINSSSAAFYKGIADGETG